MGRKASSDVYAGTVEHFANLLNRSVLEEYDYSQLSGRIRDSVVAPKNIGVQSYSSLAGVIYNAVVSEAGQRIVYETYHGPLGTSRFPVGGRFS